MTVFDGVKRMAKLLLPDGVQCAIKKVYYLRAVRSISESDEEYFPIIKCLVSPGDYVVDIGANVGTYTKYLSGLVGPNGSVYAVEPVPHTFAILRYCVRRLRMQNVEIAQCAISNRDGTAMIEIPRHLSGAENYCRARLLEHIATTQLRSVEVTCRTIDSLFADKSTSISFIKIDVEGHELPVVRGAMRTLRCFQPALLVEVTGDPDDPDHAAYQLFELLSGAGYQPYCMDGHAVRTRRRGDHRVDYFFFVSKHVEMLSHKDVCPGS